MRYWFEFSFWGLKNIVETIGKGGVYYLLWIPIVAGIVGLRISGGFMGIPGLINGSSNGATRGLTQGFQQEKPAIQAEINRLYGNNQSPRPVLPQNANPNIITPDQYNEYLINGQNR